MENILVVEDALEMQIIIKGTLGAAYKLTLVPSVEEGRQRLASESFDLVLLDASLPDGDGVILCGELRNSSMNADVPVIMVTARAAIAEKVQAFSAGADDYLTKPFEPLELKARVAAQISRRKKNFAGTGTMVRGALRLCTEQHKAYREGPEPEELKLTPMEFRLLLFLVKNEHRVVSRAEILTAVWGKSVFVVDRVIDKHVSSLRQKLGALSEYISTVPRLGYQFGQKAG